MSKHFMIDLETWGTRPGCDIRSIGAVRFDPTIGYVAQRNSAGSFYIATDNSKFPLHRDPKTVQWWKDQSEEAQAAFSNPIRIDNALRIFSRWITTLAPEPDSVRIWAHGPQFDVSIIEAAYRAVSQPVPWPYRAPRDTRTILEAAGVSLDLFRTGTAHHALDDALGQARAVCAAYRVLRGPAIGPVHTALKTAAIWFDDYAEQHTAKGNIEKAATNANRAAWLRSKLLRVSVGN